jgi:hypothetical protein
MECWEFNLGNGFQFFGSPFSGRESCSFYLQTITLYILPQRSDDLNGFQRSGKIVIVSDPSRTADIVMQLILEMPGTKEFIIIIFPRK